MPLGERLGSVRPQLGGAFLPVFRAEKGRLVEESLHRIQILPELFRSGL